MARGIIALSIPLLVLLALSVFVRTPGTSAIPGTIDILAVDLDNTGNTPTSVGAVDACVDGLAVDSTVTFDVIVNQIDPANTINGLSFTLVYDPAVMEITARSGGAAVLFYQAAPTGVYDENTGSDPLPDTDGDYRHDALELGGTKTETGPGVVAQLTLHVLSAGVSALDLTDNIEFDGTPNVIDAGANVLFPAQIIDGEIHSDGTPCPQPTPSPPPLTPSPQPTQQPTTSPPPSDVPQSATPTPTPKPTCNTTLAANAAVGATTITVTSANGCAAGDTIRIGSGSGQEDVKISSVSGATITLLAGLTKAHTAGDTVVEVASASASPTTTPRTAPSTGDGSASGGVARTLLLLATLFGVILVLTAGGSLLLARTKQKD